MSPAERPVPDVHREVAGHLLEDYGRDRGRGRKLRAQLARRFPGWSEEAIEDAVQSACGSFLDEAEGISDPGAAYAWLRTAARHALLGERRVQRQAFVVDPTEGVIDEAIAAGPGPAEELIGLEDAAELEILVEQVASSLSDRRRAILALWAEGRKKPEIATELGLSERAVKHGLEDIMDQARDVLARQAGGGCPEGESLVLRLTCGLAEAGEAIRARAHLEHCSGCSAFADQLETWREKVVVVLGPAVIEVAHPGLVGRVVGRAGEAISSARRHALGGGAQITQQASTAGYTRIPDPTPLAGVRPGAVAAVVAVCLAGGGATYCARQGVDPLSAATNLIAGTQDGAAEESAPPPARPETPVVPAETPVEAPVATPTYEPAVEEAPTTEAPATHEEAKAPSSGSVGESEPRPEPEPAPEEVTPPPEQSFEPASPDYPATESPSSSSTSSSSSPESGATTSEATRPAAVSAGEAPQFGGP